MDRIGVVDTMFARYDMGTEALDELADCPGHASVSSGPTDRPGLQGLAVAAKVLIEEHDCRIVVASGCRQGSGRQGLRHEASQGS